MLRTARTLFTALPRLASRELHLNSYLYSLKFTRNHEWVYPNGETGRVGITDYAQSKLGDVVYIELPEVGDFVEANTPCGTVESVKAASEIYSPVSGTVVKVNTAVTEQTSLVNKSAEDEELDDLLSAEEYDAHLVAEGR